MANKKKTVQEPKIEVTQDVDLNVIESQPLLDTEVASDEISSQEIIAEEPTTNVDVDTAKNNVEFTTNDEVLSSANDSTVTAKTKGSNETKSKKKSDKTNALSDGQKNEKGESQSNISNEEIEAKRISISKGLLDSAFIFILICTALMLSFVGMTAKNNGIPTFGKYSLIRYDNDFKENAEQTGISKTQLDKYQYMQFIKQSNYKIGDIVAFKKGFSSDKTHVLKNDIGKISTISNDLITFTNGQTTTKNAIIGKYANIFKSTAILTFFLSTSSYLYIIVFPLILLTIVGIIAYFVLFPNKLYIKSLSKTLESVAEVTVEKDKDKTAKKVVANEVDDYLLNSVNHIQNMKQGNFELLRLPDGVSEIQNTNYYTIVASSGNEVYQRVAKFPETIATLQEIGASDMDIIRVNMIGNSDFDQLLTTSRTKDKSLDLTEIITFLNNLPEISCIKKAGKINWTYKYKTKTVAIVREDVNNGYKISFKTYPDAAHKLNMVFMALEDSNFPSGPYWYMINNLRNLPMNVLKWLIQESYRISKMQQIKSDFVRTDTPLDKLVDLDQIVTNIKLYAELTVYDKFAVIVKNIENTNPLTTLLEDKSLKLKLENYNKEMYFQIQNNFAVSILYDKRATDQLTTAFSYDLIAALNNNENNQNQVENTATPSTKPNMSKSSTGVVKKVSRR